jgi:hypothetical protein
VGGGTWAIISGARYSTSGMINGHIPAEHTMVHGASDKTDTGIST